MLRINYKVYEIGQRRERKAVITAISTRVTTQNV